jgi:cytochrome c biogenesis protein CcmG, thiol:disulfide interchange protein DsbE
MRGNFSALIPVVAFLGLVTAFGLGLRNDPKNMPSMLIDRQLPQFQLPALVTDTVALNSETLSEKGLVLINVFSSWCSGCRLEHPFLMEKAKDPRFQLVGLNWKDDPDNARQFLSTYGNPFEMLGTDPSGRAGIDLGVTGVPETFVIDSTGRVRLRVPGPMSPEIWKNEIEPLLAKEQRP